MATITVYSSLYDKLSSFKLIRSGYLNTKTLPYVSLIKVGTALDTRDTESNRLESHLYDVYFYDDSLKHLHSEIADCKTLLDKQALSIATRRFLALQYLGKNTSEIIRGIYLGIIHYEIIVQKDFSSSLKRGVTSGANFITALYNRYKAYDNLSAKVSGFVTTRYGLENWTRPFIFVPEYSTIWSWGTTENTRIEETEFELTVEDIDPDNLENILEEIDNTFSYCQFNLTDKTFITLEWLGNSLIELEPGIWQGSVKYRTLLEEAL